MRSLGHACIAVAVATVGLAACMQKPTTRIVRDFPPCDTISATVTTAGRGHAALLAQSSVRRQLPDVRGDLIGVGYRQIRTIGQSTTCTPYRVGPLSTGLVSCTARIRVCGR